MVSKLEIPLNNGHSMPQIGLGTYRIDSRDLISSVLDAGLKCGYRLIDTACVYRNEEYIGEALKTLLPKYKLSREDIFITSKLSPSQHGYQEALDAINVSLSKLKLSYLDLYLIHWPGVNGIPANSPENSKLRAESWRALATAQRQGLLKSIGVSNYAIKHLQEILGSNPPIVPAVNQVEFHPFFKQTSLLNFCRHHNIVVQAYCSLGGTSELSLLRDPSVNKVAAKVKKTPAQVLLRWALQQEVAVIPKSVNAKRIAENIELDFTLPKPEMEEINRIALDHKFSWNPENVA